MKSFLKGLLILFVMFTAMLWITPRLQDLEPKFSIAESAGIAAAGIAGGLFIAFLLYVFLVSGGHLMTKMQKDIANAETIKYPTKQKKNTQRDIMFVSREGHLPTAERRGLEREFASLPQSESTDPIYWDGLS